MLSGRYRSDALLSKWSKETESEACLLPGCSALKGDLKHLLSGTCIPLRRTMALALSRGLEKLSRHLHLLGPVVASIQNPDILVWIVLLLDPSTHTDVIRMQQDFGKKSIWPLFHFSRTIIWSIHRKRLTLKGQQHYL